MGEANNAIDLTDARHALDQLAVDHASLAGPAAILNEVLPVLFAGECSTKIELTEAAALGKLKDGVPVVRGEPLQIEYYGLATRWSAICDALQRHQGNPEAAKLSVALRDGTLRIDRLVNHVLAGDVDTIAGDAEAVGTSPKLTASVLRLTLFSFMSKVSGALAPILAQHGWGRGHCPVCGSWPLLAELRGLEQLRYLRCGLCAADWQFSRLQCPFCNERDHRQLSYFVVEAEGTKQRVVTCDGCRGYLKTISTISALEPPDLLVTDLMSIHLDLVATERGYAVPISR